MDRKTWPMIRDFDEKERESIRHLCRTADENGIVEAGVAIRLGKSWRINREKLPEFLGQLTLRTLERERQNPQAKRRAHTLKRSA
jgi:hypothetical protein